MMDTIGCVLNGDTAIFIDGEEKALVLSTKKFPVRAINFPQKEAGLKGPRDSFNENFRINTALLRRRIKDPKMKLKQGFAATGYADDVRFFQDFASRMYFMEEIE